MARPKKLETTASNDVTSDVKSETSNRRFKKHSSVMHDLYKLASAKMLKNVARDANDGEEVEPEFLKLEHCHIFHTVDSKGNPQKHCSPIGGHFHVMELITPADDDNPAVYKCSGPKKYVRHRVTKKPIIVPYEKEYTDGYGAVFTDNHTHEVQYVSSEEFKPRKMNPEAAVYIAKLQSETEPKPVAGISG